MRTTVSYLTKKLEKIHQDSILEILHDSYINTECKKQSRYDDFEIFDTLAGVNNRIQNSDCISGVTILFAKAMYGVIIKTSTTYDFYQFKFNDVCGFHNINLWYTKVKVKGGSIISFVSKEQLSRKVINYILLVPCDPNVTNEITEYTIISKNWKCRDVSNMLSTYSPSVHSLNEMIQNIYF